MDPDPKGPQTYGSYGSRTGSGFATLEEMPMNAAKYIGLYQLQMLGYKKKLNNLGAYNITYQ
jgi:hypothetical protein